MRRDALNDAQVEALFAARPDFSALTYEEGSKPWPLQSRGQAGYRAPQDPATLPNSRAPQPGKLPAHRAGAEEGEALRSSAPGEWVLAKGWMLQEAPEVTTAAQQIATPGFVARGWMRATVPGTVLTTSAVEEVASAGGEIIISPNSNPAVIGATKAKGLISLPAFFTPRPTRS